MTFPLKIVGLLKSKNQIPTDGLIAYYPFNGNANDESGNGNNGTVTGATLTTDRKGVSNSAYSFNNQKISITRVSDFDATFTGDFTISMWIYPTFFPGFSRLFSMRDAPADGFEILLAGSSVVNSNYNNSTSDGFTQTLVLNTWYSIIMTKESGILKLYFNNILNGTTFDYSARGAMNTTVSPVIANYAAAYPSVGIIGKMDDIRIYNRALTTAEITTLYNE